MAKRTGGGGNHPWECWSVIFQSGLDGVGGEGRTLASLKGKSFGWKHQEEGPEREKKPHVYEEVA